VTDATGRVVIDCFPDSAARYRDGYAVVVVDVIRATTTAVTGVALGRRCFPERTITDAVTRASRLEQPLLVGELGGHMPFGFDLTNSPAALARRADVHRPMVLLSSSGTELMKNAEGCEAVYIACFRNYRATVLHAAGRHSQIAVLGAGTRGEFREEDQMCCAWIAEGLLKLGYVAADRRTEELVERWSGAPPDACLVSRSVIYLQQSGQLEDLDFILARVDDVTGSFRLADGEVTLAE